MKSSYNKSKDLPNIAFELNYQFPIHYMGFSQRKFIGFRNRSEFDKKRIVIASKRDFVVVGYDYEKRVYELLRSFVNYDEEIRFISFLEDHIPSFLFLIIYNKKE